MRGHHAVTGVRLEPVVEGQTVAGTQIHHQVLADTTQAEVRRRDARTKDQFVVLAASVVIVIARTAFHDGVGTVATIEVVGVSTCTAIEDVVAAATGQAVAAVTTVEDVVAHASQHLVVARAAIQNIITCTAD